MKTSKNKAAVICFSSAALLACALPEAAHAETSSGAVTSSGARVIVPKMRTFGQRIFGWIAREAYGRAKGVSPEQQQAQDFLNKFPAYQESVERASSLGFTSSGQITHYQIPVYRVIFLVFHRQIGVEPVSVWVQGLANQDKTEFGMIIVGADSQSEIVIDKAVFLTSDKAADAVGPERQKFIKYLKFEMASCAEPCKRKALQCLMDKAVLGQFLIGRWETGFATYVLSVAKSSECGGCAANKCVQALTDYVFALPLPSELNDQAASATAK
ncbi:MAG: hypothetical protein ACRDHZ_15430 [Ktedonobacteraceae bacterium]